MTDKIHSSYPSPTIQEALCEIHFPADLSSFASDFARIWDRLRVEFPRLETYVDLLPPPVTGMIYSGPLQSHPRFILHHASRKILLQFSPGLFALNTLPPYLGWQTLEEDLRTAWQSVEEVLAVSQVTQITMRYINRVPLTLPWEESHGWLIAGDYIPAAVAQAVPPFQSRVQIGTGTESITTLSIGHQNVPGELDQSMIVDLERVISGDLSAVTIEVTRQADALHTDIWDIFAAIKGPRWNATLEGKL